MDHIRSYVIRSGRMSGAQKRAYREFSRYIIPFNQNSKEKTDFERVFGNRNPLTVEIGFGMGIATALIAEKNPLNNYLGIEVHKPGIGRLLWEIEKRRLDNVRIVEYDAVEVVEKMLCEGAVSAFHIFFPDPWPKKRHHKRRLVKRPFTDLLASRLKSGAYIYLVTDWADYGDWALREFEAAPCLRNVYPGFAEPQKWRPETGFERKGLEKSHEIKELYFIKTDN
ncbi:MAG: tRNA (guanosine(46)-N7)-methyltransferase TrmB [Treponema sp.]|jgi:tRNA (guanine-N7-)-methyltransferase|nr:tRNA (guanosine(46)-N7)-methyltransferase TrmB [Treponema sp.]